MRLFAAVLTLLPTLALADSWRDAVQDAAELMDQALGAARRGGPTCRNAMKVNIDRSIDNLDDLLDGRGGGGGRLREIRAQVATLAVAADRSSCPERVGEKLRRAAQKLEDARDERHDDHNDGRVSRGSNPVELGALRLFPSTIHDTENVVRVDVSEVRFHNIRGANFRLGLRVRAQNGQFGEWQVDTMYQVPQDEYVWSNAKTFFVRHSTLRGIDTANGRFVVRVSVLNEQNEELGSVDQPLEINFRGPPAPAPAPMVVAPPPGAPAPGVRPIPTLARRDCGTGADPGCDATRSGIMAMDAGTYGGLLRSLAANPSDLGREQMVYAVLVNNGLTAMQFGAILDLLRSEISKLNVTRKAAPRLTNPHDALGWSTKFRSGLNQGEYVKIISAQG